MHANLYYFGALGKAYYRNNGWFVPAGMSLGVTSEASLFALLVAKCFVSAIDVAGSLGRSSVHGAYRSHSRSNIVP